jgi:hypothetical protein
VIAPAKTGSDKRSRIAVINTAHGNKGMRSINIPNARKFKTVLIKFTAPRREETPARWRLKIVKSTDAPP